MRPARSILVSAIALTVLAYPSPAAAYDRNEVVAKMVDYLNKARGRHGLRPLRDSRALMRSAQGYSHSLMKRNTFGHSGLARAGRFRYLGEALEMHSGRRTRPLLALRLLLRSPSHRRLILRPGTRVVGAGVTRGRFRGRPEVLWVLHFGRRS